MEANLFRVARSAAEAATNGTTETLSAADKIKNSAEHLLEVMSEKMHSTCHLKPSGIIRWII